MRDVGTELDDRKGEITLMAWFLTQWNSGRAECGGTGAEPPILSLITPIRLGVPKCNASQAAG